MPSSQCSVASQPASSPCSSSSSMRSKQSRTRERLKKRYASLLEELCSKQHELTTDPTSLDVVLQYIKQSTTMAGYVTDTREACYDTKYLRQISEISTNLVLTTTMDETKFDPLEFFNNAASYTCPPSGSSTTPQRISFSGIGNSVAAVGLQLPDAFKHVSADEELPTGEVIVKERKVHQRQKPSEEAALVVVNSVDDIEANGHNLSSFVSETEKTTETVERFFGCLCEESSKYDDNAVDFFEMILDPFSFGRTVENLFYLSFLIRDAHVSLYLDDAKLPMLKPERRSKVGASPRVLANTKRGEQLVMHLTMRDWELLCEEWKIKEPLFKR